MSFEIADNPRDLLQQMLAELDERELRRQIDDPVDAAVAEYVGQLSMPSPPTQRDVLDAVSGLLRHVYCKGLAFRRELPTGQVRREAAFLLENCYAGTGGRGFSVALSEACAGGHDVVVSVLMTLGDAMKAVERRKFLWVTLTGRLSLLPLESRYRLAEHVWEAWSPHLSKVAALSPREVAARLPELVLEFAESDNHIRRLFAS